MTASRTAQAWASSTPGSSSTSWKCTSSSRAVSSARSTYRPTQKSASATRLSILVSSLLLVLVGTTVGFGAAYRLRRKRRRLVGFGVPARRGGQHPGVLGTAALAGVDDQAPLPQRHPGQPAGQHPYLRAVVDRERPQVDVPGQQLVAELRRRGRQQHQLLRDPPPGRGQ